MWSLILKETGTRIPVEWGDFSVLGWFHRVFLAGVLSLIQSRTDDLHAETETPLEILGTGWISERTTGGWWGGGAEGWYHLDRDFQLWLLSPFSSFQAWERPQQVEGFAAQAVVPRALYAVGAGPRGKAAPPHPHRALPAGEGVLIPHRGNHQG